MSDDFDDFLAEVTGTSSTSVAASSNQNNHFSIDDDSDIHDQKPYIPIKSTTNITADSDFMAWLELEEDGSKDTKAPNSESSLIDNKTDNIEISANTESSKEKPKPAVYSESFLDEVFGISTPTNTIADTPLAPSNDTPISSNNNILSINYTEELESLINSSEPDIAKIKSIIFDHLGYIPSQYRVRVWSLLIGDQDSSGSRTTKGWKDEAATATEQGMTTSDSIDTLHNISEEVMFLINKDIDELLQKYITHHPHISVDTRASVKDCVTQVLTAYLSRKNLSYSHKHLLLLAPLVLSTGDHSSGSVPPVPAVSACFGRLAEDFVPFLDASVCLYAVFFFVVLQLILQYSMCVVYRWRSSRRPCM